VSLFLEDPVSNLKGWLGPGLEKTQVFWKKSFLGFKGC